MKVKELLLIKDKEELLTLTTILRYIRPLNVLCGVKAPKLTEMTYKDVYQVREYMSQGLLIEASEYMTKVKRKTILNSEHVPFTHFIKYMEVEVKQVEKLEAFLNEAESPEDMERQLDLANCGIDKLKKYGIINVLDELAKGSILEWDRIEQMPYMDVYYKLRRDKDKADIQRAYNKIQAERNKERLKNNR